MSSKKFNSSTENVSGGLELNAVSALPIYTLFDTLLSLKGVVLSTNNRRGLNFKIPL